MSQALPAPWFAPLLVLLLFAVALGLPALLPLAAAAHLHLMLAVGVLPLILAAMGHFTPVLTRGAPPPRWLGGLPLMVAAGGAAVSAFLQWGRPPLVLAGALAVVAVAVQGGWMVGRARAAFAPPHPGLAWYLAALGCLSAALAAVLLAAWRPEWWVPLRRLHLHLNLLGFVGLTAVGTLWVLLPTVAGYAEPAAGERLRRDLPWALGGTLLVAVGAALWWPAAVVGGVAWLWGLGRLVAPLLGRRRAAVWSAPGASRALALAALGLGLLLVQGLLHGVALVAAPSPLVFVLLFLLPLVSGAAAHLIPLWRWPGPPTARREAVHRRLARGHATRGALFMLCGVAALAGVAAAPYLAALVVFQFVLQVIFALFADP
ncbi:hypothetical protein [Endothiovibrio diazotrophicus]